MTLHTSTREQQRLREIAREYRQRGYDVIVEPSADQLPAYRFGMAQEILVADQRLAQR